MTNPNRTEMQIREKNEIEQRAIGWVILLASGRATVADGEAFRQWCAHNPGHVKAFVECRKHWQGLQRAASDRAPDEASARSPAKIIGPSSSARLSRRALLGGALAASIGWLAISPPLQLWPSLDAISADYRTGIGEQREVALNAHVKLQLNTQTAINLLRQQGVVTGMELRSGETEVLAQPGNGLPFVVLAGNGQIQAQEALFNVRYIDESTCVTCLAGEVTVEREGRQILLQRHQQLRYDDQIMLPVERVDTASVSAWRQRMLVFNNIPMSQVIEEINRYRTGKIVLLNARLGASLVQARLSVDRFNDFTSLIQRVYDAKVRYLPGGIVVIS
ncbi:TPA: FecR domain-containing protein [Klebsiella pneumoniae]|nr:MULTISPECIES: FecR domain-containing protein [Enterobacterales]VGQ03364.1 hypothetical protein SB00098_05460 [Klebsiella quasipneumoniae subsp. quasipneumoniae]HDX4353221.1 FecR domain-containing protein [Klebsiella michiganensis]AUU08219.1 DUF4880 domain-containing protein [Serratia marcescens]EKV1236137.1 FecR domain-containing protein [Klebsiella pneumoniae]EKY0628085.1 FecR domain-containing protein [Klebsiella pneumoniae]